MNLPLYPFLYHGTSLHQFIILKSRNYKVENLTINKTYNAAIESAEQQIKEDASLPVIITFDTKTLEPHISVNFKNGELHFFGNCHSAIIEAITYNKNGKSRLKI